MRDVSAARAAYGRSSSLRSAKEQEADVFVRVNAALRSAPGQGSLAVAKAVADDLRLWLAVGDLLRDPGNALPVPLRAAIVSVGQAVLRECDLPSPDLQFLIGINEQMAAGLAGT